jgi:hypothetical protein
MKPAAADRSVGRSDRLAADPQSDDKAASRQPRPQESGPAKPEVPEVGGPKGPEPTRYGDWEKGCRCIDF